MADRPETQTEYIIRNATDGRTELASIEQFLNHYKLMVQGFYELDEECDKGEVLANITLAYRHVEDARMRLGKVIQAASGGVSIYDKPAEDEANQG